MLVLSSESGTGSLRAALPDKLPQIKRKATGAAFVLVIALMFAAALVLAAPSLPAAHAASFGIDGTGACSNGNGVSCAITLTTTNPADVVIIFTGTTSGHLTSPPTVPAGCTGLTNRVIYAGSGSSVPVIREDYCTTSSTLSSQSFSCTATGRITCVVFAISGANTASPFDASGSLPCKASAATGSSGTNAVACTVSTSGSNDLVFGLAGESGGSGVWTAGTNGVCSTYKCAMAGSTNSGMGAAVDYAISTAAIGSSSIGATYSTNSAYAIVADAVQEAVTIVTVTSTQTVTSTATSTPAVNTATVTSTPAVTTVTTTILSSTPVNSTVITVVATGTFCVQGNPAQDVTCSTSSGSGLSQTNGPSLTSVGVGGLLLAGAAAGVILLNRRRSRNRSETRTVSA